MWGPPGTFSPDGLESLTPETYAPGGSLSSRVVPCRADMEPGRLSCLRAIPLEVPLLSTVIATHPFSPGSLWAVFLGCLRTVLTAITRASACFFVFFCLSFPHIPCCNRLSESVATDYLKTDLAHTPVGISYDYSESSAEST